MYGQNSGYGNSMYRQGFQPGSQNRNFSTGRMEDQQDPYQDPDQEDLNNPTPESIPQTSRDPQHNGSYIVIPPNQTKRNKLLTMANKEEEEYKNFIETRRSGPIHLTPQKLGGQTSEMKARQQQQITQSQSKYQKKFQRDEYRRKQREEEEAKIQEMKESQRKKAEKLEEKRRLDEIERKQKWHEEMLKKNSEFLDRFSYPADSSSSYNSYGKQPHTWESCSDYKEEQDWDEYNDEEREFQLALKESMKTKMEEDKRRQEMEKNQPRKENMKSHRQQLMEEDERKLHKMKEENNQKERQKSYSFYKQQLKEEEERKLQEMKEEQRRKSELLETKKAANERERQLSQQEEQRRVNNAFLDKLQTQNTRRHEYNGESNTWA